MSDLYRDFIDQKADQIINSLGGTITPAPANAELYRDFLDRKFDDVINACNGIRKLKKHTYTGDGNVPNDIVFPDVPELIICIQGNYSATTPNYGVNNSVDPIIWNKSAYGVERPVYFNQNPGVAVGAGWNFQISYNDKTMTLTGTNATGCFNQLNVEYTVYYY